MAKKLVKLTFQDIVLSADAETIREAYEARLKIDELLVKREEAYRQIEAIELQVEELVGEEGLFVYPEPPVPVAGFSKPAPAARPAPPKPKPEPEVPEEEEAETEIAEEETTDEKSK
ncbi:hypothetical protein [Pontiella sulfatireligans]|uniref:Uncharacterized protein n=1 Tax=Pontiella sulfatireligans TaxID=2750658 RepID=A0A6C2UPV9_9BACT|nr:hypothetical protein [Pontiella sulfatireligans]VGO21311.1 hypothetical protein SCARR_03383 [Pontiella sulfatireligans]